MVNDIMAARAKEYLEKNQLLNIDMLECIRRNTAELLAVSDRGVLLCCRPAGAYMLSAADADTSSAMLSCVTASDLFVAHQDFSIGEIQRRFGLMHTMPCHQAVYFSSDRLAETDAVCQIRPLDASHLPFVHAHYTNIDDSEYLLERLNAGVFFGAYVQNELTGFVGEHSEGSLGLLEVLPEYRRRGIAEALERFAVNRHLSLGYVPFSQIKTNNTASLALQKKLGLTISDKLICWLY